MAEREQEDACKKRCVDRYDSCESEDSGVAVLSSTESGGCSGSELTEPGSPYSPASSTTSSEECGGARVPPWSREPSSPVAASAPPQPPPSHHSHKRHNLETLIANRLQAKQPVQLTATSTPVKPARSQQVRITEYFNHKMKTHNGLKREIACWNRLEDSKKRCMQKASVTQDLEKYISLLSQTLSPKVLLDVSKMDPPEAAKGMVDTKTCPLPSLLTNGIPNTRIEANKVKGYATKTIDDSTVNGVTCGSNNFVLNNSGNCNSPGSKKVTQRRANPNKRMNRKLPTVGKTTWYKLEDGTNKMQCVKQTPKENATSATISNLPVDKSSVTFSDTAPKITMANSNGLRQIPITFNGGVNNMHQIPMSNAQNCNIINVSQHCNGTVTTSTISPFVAVPQTVMLTALRIPQNSNPQHNLNVAQSNGLNGFTRQNMNITSPSKLNGQFVFPLVQNYNGTVVQIPNLVTKVGHNFVIPHPTQLQSQRQDTQQPTQMLINGTLLKMTSSVAPTYSELMTKPTTTSNISFPVMNKSMNTGMPTVMTAKPHYTINMGHPMLMPQPGFFINPVPNNISKDTYGNIETSNNFMQANNSAVSNSYAAVQPSHIVQSVSPCNQVSHTSSIPIPPTKPPDKDTGIMQHPTAMSMEKETTILEQKKVSSFNNNNYPNLTRLLNTNVPLTPHILSRPFAEVCQSTEKLFDITPLEESKSRSFEELQTDSPMDSISPVSTPESDETDFTQITVLKDVTSDVRNTILETTFSCVTNESSESGLGTDKSIDSPSDSLTSKECDDDSCLSLSVSVCSVEVQPCQKSPILKQPKTIRFPRQSVEQSTSEQRPKGRRSVPNSVTLCRWETCTEKFESATDLLEHLQMVHVNAQAGRSNYVCEWTGCKVRGKPSCSRLWLERHALSHGGNKPYKCIVDDCERRFSTQILLERHVNNHFNEHSANLSSSKKSAESGPKLIRRNGKVLRYRRQPWSARMFDFFDGGMMEGLAWRLVRATSWRVGAVGRPSGAHTLTLSAALTATRYNHATNTREALVSYNPPHVLDDEWIPEDEVKKTKTVIMSELPVRSKVLLYEQFCSSYRTASTADDIQTCVAPPPPLPSPPPSSATCDSSRMLNNLISKQMEPLNGFRRMNGCAQPIRAPVEELSSWQDRKREEPKMEVSGAAKRKQGRKYGGNAFWPCGR